MKKYLLFLFCTLLSPLISQALPDDAGVLSIDSVLARCEGNQDVYATVYNYGTNPLTSVTVNWSLNSLSQTPLVYNLNLTPGAAQQVLLGQATFSSAMTLDISVWTSLPNGTSDSDPTNDLAVETGLLAALSGSYTIGGSLPDYSSIGGAFQDLENCGVCSPVEFVIRPGVYPQQLVLHEVPGSSFTNTVSFYAENNDSMAVSIEVPSATTSADNYTIKLDGASHIIFHHLTFIRSGTGVFSTILDISGISNDIRIYNNRFLGPTSVSTANADGSRSCIFSPAGAGGNDRLIENNYFLGNANGLWINGDNVNHSTGMRVFNNYFENFYVGAFLLYQDGPEVSGNTMVRSVSTSTIDYYGISLRFCSDRVLVSKNKITAYTGSWGIRLRDCVADATDRGWVVNNFVQIGTANTGRGISLEDNCGYQNIVHNSVHYNGTNVNNGRGFFLDGAGTVGIVLLNNIFVNSGGGFAWYVSDAAQAGLVNSNHNCLYSSGTLAYWNGTQADLALLRSASGLELNSVSGDPMFTSATNLHASGSILAGQGFPLAFVVDDIDGDLRHPNFPDIGADEFSFVGLPTSQQLSQIQLYPNPARDYVFINWINVVSAETEVRIFDLMGKVAGIQSIVPEGTGTLRLDIHTLSAGLYIVKMKSGHESYSALLLVQR